MIKITCDFCGNECTAPDQTEYGSILLQRHSIVQNRYLCSAPGEQTYHACYKCLKECADYLKSNWIKHLQPGTIQNSQESSNET